ncbi:MAG: class I adenylate-forming enzyme family protein [Pseudomonadales bacterium]|jgi:long-chain acyl-CoA synthetase|nr:class I adenylate-forming enzyme family protein [Pseudomonadales bacterium]
MNDATAPLDWATANARLTAPGAPFELETVPVRGTPLRCFRHAPANLGALFAQSLAHGDRDFLVYGDERLSFAETHDRALALAARFQQHFGLVPGDRVAIAMRNYPEWVIAFMAATLAGYVAVPMNAWWSADELVYGLGDCGARLLLVDAQRLERIAPRLGDLDLRVLVARADAPLPAGVADVAAEIAAGAALTLEPVAVDPDDDAVIMYTSGTTGFPKGAVSTHRASVSSVLAFEVNTAAFGLMYPPPAAQPEAPAPALLPAMLLTVPLFHVTGCNAILLASFRTGRKVVMMYKWDAEQALALIEAERITSFTGVPTMTWEMLQSPNFERYDTSSLATIGGGGAPAPPEQVRRVEARFKGRPGIGYGLTETNAVGAQNAGDDYVRRPRSTGRPPVVVDIEAFDDAGRQLPRGALGELWIRGPVVFRGYWNREDATAEAISDGWFHSGDIGRVDEDGFVFIEDRKKDMVIRGGENVYCAEVEAALYELEGVSEAVVFGVPDERLGEQVAAVVVTREGQVLTPEAVRAQLAVRLAHFKVPEHLYFQEEQLPRNASGKFLKREVRAQLLTKLGHA